MEIDKRGWHMNAWAWLYVAMIVFWIFMLATEVSGIWLTMPEKAVDAPAQPAPAQEGESNG